MTDLLIRNIDEEAVRRIDANAERQGLSRSEYLRREVSRLAQIGARPATRADLARSAELFADLADESVMEQAWK
ncbi:ribbon-helix-helix protein, CopG family [Phytoactinopolyspora mesophila]|uniref:Ribbon-helix-helix protein, CopG family n=1 Tax=Phytoactinopolyspora mesophila TaxID=2650750 RepID=A0A7K3LYW8_9ACTN|nr:ribbon-helix-helix protein, CopG family [Phytoactinopolyspora mesophila]NDL56216.1 ribbon-helix-helix protein, CopG family [Phytoactinopolyspora mesophila]